MVKVPGVTPDNYRCNGTVNLIDLYPTLVELCGLPKNPLNDGRSFAPLLHDPGVEWNHPILTTAGFGNHRIYDGRYSYTHYLGSGGEELYDHQVDPMEWNNLVRDPNYAAIKARLEKYIPASNEPPSPLNPK